MGLFQDNFSMLSELERLAAMVQDPARVQEIGADEWPLAMIACGLVTCNDPDRLQENLDAYAIFASKVAPAGRKASLAQLVRFITARKGDGWRALLPYTLAEPEPVLSRAAAMQLATLAQPGEAEKLTGVAELARLLARRADTPATVLEALLSLSDLRVQPMLEPLYSQAPERLASLLVAMTPAPNHLSFTWILGALDAQPELAEQVVALLERMAPAATAVIDLVMPIPTWAYTKPAPQPLHGWTRAEYFPRMLPVLSRHLSEAQISRLKAAFGA